MNLCDIAKIILVVENRSVSKVRFAKTIYFVHKELIRCGMMKREDIAYIRMPLGPVPVGFMTLADDCKDIRVDKADSDGLAYDTENYSIVKRRFGSAGAFKSNSLRTAVEKVLVLVRPKRTSELVEISHEEPSWKNKTNGQRFFISDADMENKLVGNSHLSDEYQGEQESMQASLIRGMIDDIVDESTSLEYPDER